MNVRIRFSPTFYEYNYATEVEHRSVESLE